jgi:hypothetical protein
LIIICFDSELKAKSGVNIKKFTKYSRSLPQVCKDMCRDGRRKQKNSWDMKKNRTRERVTLSFSFFVLCWVHTKNTDTQVTKGKKPKEKERKSDTFIFRDQCAR